MQSLGTKFWVTRKRYELLACTYTVQDRWVQMRIPLYSMWCHWVVLGCIVQHWSLCCYWVALLTVLLLGISAHCVATGSGTYATQCNAVQYYTMQYSITQCGTVKAEVLSYLLLVCDRLCCRRSVVQCNPIQTVQCNHLSCTATCNLEVRTVYVQSRGTNFWDARKRYELLACTFGLNCVVLD